MLKCILSTNFIYSGDARIQTLKSGAPVTIKDLT